MSQDKVRIRPLEREDLDCLNKWRNDSNIFSQLGGGYFPISKTEMSKWMDNFSRNDRNNVKFIIEYGNKSIGYVSLNNINYINRTGELGIYIGESGYHGKGIATKGLSLLEEFAQDYLNLRKIKVLVNNDNEAALKLYEKKSYTIVGNYSKERYVQGQWVDVIIMEKFI
ncbi:GNAT family N-acetyltransferase [Salinicoccus roseus]|uniref:GNAT family N-acetyltransferase n=1 Tax=Salinicoccus roseus TaxID=45670 RepID=UPI00230070D4|nr:GNAT family protein [Salinicoccus roseus]